MKSRFLVKVEIILFMITACLFTGCIIEELLPQGIVAVSEDGQLGVSWNIVEDALSYELWLGTSDDSQDAERVAEDILVNRYDVKDLTNDSTYYVWIVAVSQSGKSGFGTPVVGTPAKQADPDPEPEPEPEPLSPPAAATLSAITEASTAVEVTWSLVSGATSYQLWVATADDSTTATLGATSATSPAEISGLVNGTTYYVWIKSLNSAGASAFSDSLSAVAGKDIAGLSGITLSGGTLVPAFNSETTAYTLAASYLDESVVATGVAIDTDASVGGDSGATTAIPFGASSISIMVTAENLTEREYTIAVTRATAVIYNDNGSTSGDVPASPTVTALGVEVSVLGNDLTLVKTNFTFTGWNSNAAGTGVSYAAGTKVDMPATNLTLFAKWVPEASIVFQDDFSTDGYLDGQTPDVGGAWSVNNGNTLEVSSGVMDSYTASTAMCLAYGDFTQTLGVGQTLTLTFKTVATTHSDFATSGWVGLSLYSGGASGIEQVFMGSIGLVSGWGVDGALPGVKTSTSPLISTEVQTAYFSYVYDSGAWSFTVGGVVLSGIADDSIALNALRIGKDSDNNANIAITDIYVDMQ